MAYYRTIFSGWFFRFESCSERCLDRNRAGERANVQSGSDAVNGGLGLLLSGTVKRSQL
jgi:hypothetical protein